MNKIEFKNVSVALGRVEIFTDISFSAGEGEFLALLGPNGVGKTTVLKSAVGLLPYQGSILLNGNEVRTVSPNELGRSISYIPQGHDVHWPMTVRDIVNLGRLPYRSVFSVEQLKDDEAIEDALDATDLRAFSSRPFDQLSGGEKGRVMIARALASGTGLMLADEPTAALDPFHQLQILEMLRQKVDAGLSVIVILHDIMLAAQFADRVMLMHNKNIVMDGSPEEVIRSDVLENVYKITAAQEIVYKKGLWERV